MFYLLQLMLLPLSSLMTPDWNCSLMLMHSRHFGDADVAAAIVLMQLPMLLQPTSVLHTYSETQPCRLLQNGSRKKNARTKIYVEHFCPLWLSPKQLWNGTTKTKYIKFAPCVETLSWLNCLRNKFMQDFFQRSARKELSELWINDFHNHV